MSKKQAKKISQVAPKNESLAAKPREDVHHPKSWEEMSYQEILKLSQKEIDKIIELMTNESGDYESGDKENQSAEDSDLNRAKRKEPHQERTRVQNKNPLKLKKLGLGEVSAYGAPYGCDTSTHLTYSC